MHTKSGHSWRGSLLSCLMILVGAGQEARAEAAAPAAFSSPNAASWCPSPTATSPSNLTPQPFRSTLEGGNATSVNGCSGRYFQYEQSMGSGAQLHVVGVYQGALGTDGKRSVQVRVSRQGASVLVLSAYSPTTWNVRVEPGASLERIIVSGYYAQQVLAPAGVPIEIHSSTQTQDSLGPTAYQWPSSSATQLVSAAEDRIERNLSSFRGCYEGASFEIGEPGALRPENPVSTVTEPTVPKGCESLTTESAYCMTLDGNTPTVVGLDTGRTCAGKPTQVSGLYDLTSLAWNGNYLYGCLRDQGLVRLSLVDGSADIAPVACDAVTSYRNGLLTLQGMTPVHFDTFRNAARQMNSCTDNRTLWASRIATLGDQGYAAWHSTGTIETFPLNRAESPRPLALSGFNDWVMGLDALEDGRLVILGRSGELSTFNSTTGAALGKLVASRAANGLACKLGKR